MTVKDKYFTIKINAKSPEELDRRIADNISRGFELVRLYEDEKEGHDWKDSGYRDRDGAKYRYNGCHVFRHYGAIMRRANTK